MPVVRLDAMGSAGEQVGWPVRASAVGPLTVGSAAWRFQGQLHLTIVAKATFALVAEGAMHPIAAEPVRTADGHDSRRAVGSLGAVRETVPRLGKAEILLFGHAYPGADQPSSRQRNVRLAAGRGDTVLVDKRLLVCGDRQPDGEPEPFERVVLGYERALGGIGWEDNPLGVGRGLSDDALPNILCPADPDGTVASVGPIPPQFPERRKRLGRCSRQALEASIAEIPADFDWTYFQSAPADQRIEAICGDEWLDLEGVLPERDRLRSRLPGVRVLARIYQRGQDEACADLVLRADQWIIEPDHERCSLVWRGDVAVDSEQALETMTVVAGLELAGEPVSWPAPGQWAQAMPASAPALAEGPPSSHDLENLGSTVSLDGAAEPLEPDLQQPASQTESAMDLPPEDGTVLLSDGALSAAMRNPSGRAPFAITPAKPSGAEQAPRLSSSIPGAPWSAERSRSVPLPSDEMESTARVREDHIAPTPPSPAPPRWGRVSPLPAAAPLPPSSPSPSPPPSSAPEPPPLMADQVAPAPAAPQNAAESAPRPPAEPEVAPEPAARAAPEPPPLTQEEALEDALVDPSELGLDGLDLDGPAAKPMAAPKVPALPKPNNPMGGMYGTLGGAIKKG